MATEEPSVIAAASYGASIVARSGGFTTSAPETITTGQLYVRNCSPASVDLVRKQALDLERTAAPLLARMQSRGGGWRGIDADWIAGAEVLRVHVHVDVRDAMGANAVNSVMESLRGPVERLTGGDVVMAILSNAATHRLTTASFAVPAARLARAGRSGEEIAERIALAALIAREDPARAVTHNKGIMNGITAVALATGNDTRALEAGAHAYAARDGVYRGLSSFEFVDGELHGRLSLPVTVGTVGGAAGIHPASSAALRLLGSPGGADLARIACAIGLGQNLAALFALVSEGIQTGHMGLHANRVAWAAGATPAERPAVVEELRRRADYSATAAREILDDLRSGGATR
jgi:hydroxymethylglutaryl-CoA reductase